VAFSRPPISLDIVVLALRAVRAEVPLQSTRGTHAPVATSRDGVVDVRDLVDLLADRGPCP
jgi:hypothetical protein